SRVRLASGAGASIAPESGVREGEFLVALDVHAAVAGGPAGYGDPKRVALQQADKRVARREARIFLASRVEREWLTPNASELVHRFDSSSGTTKASVVDRYDALVLAERPVKADPDVAAQLLARAWLECGPDP